MSYQEETEEHAEAVRIIEKRAIEKVMAMRIRIKSLESQLSICKADGANLAAACKQLESQLQAADGLAKAVKDHIGKSTSCLCQETLATYEKMRRQ